MPKLYAGLGLFLLLGLGFWYHGNQKYQSGVNAERAKWQSERLELIAQRDAALQKTESEIIKEKVIWRDRIQTIQVSTDNSGIPVDIERVLCESGVFIGCKM